MSERPVRLTRHADHDPALICRPALGYGLCEVLGGEERSDEETRGGDYDVWGLDFGIEGGKA